MALLLLDQSQPFPAPEHVGLRDATLVPIRFNEIPPQQAAGLEDLERRKLLECYEVDREELEYQHRKAAYRKVEPPTEVYRMPEGCLEAKRQDAERQRREADALRYCLMPPPGRRMMFPMPLSSPRIPRQTAGQSAQKSPALAGLSSRRNVERENRTCGVDRRGRN